MAVDQYVSGTIYQQGVAVQPTLVSGTNIKTVDSNSILGSGNLVVANPKVISASYVDGTAITGTLVETVSQSLLVPANTFTSGMLEVLCRMTKTGTAGTSTIKMYKNTSNTLTGATLISVISSAISAGSIFSQGIRTFRINSNTLSGYSSAITNNLDYANTNGLISTTFTTNVDNYILFTIQLGSIADSANISMARLTQYK